MGSVFEVEVHEEVDRLSELIKEASFIAYVNLHGSFQGIMRVVGEELTRSLVEIAGKAVDKCLYTRFGLKANDYWDEIYLLMCNNVIIGVHGEVGKTEKFGKKCLEEVVNKVNVGAYSRGVIELVEIPLKLVEEQLHVSLVKEVKPPVEAKPAVPEPRLTTPPKPPEIERAVEGISETIPIETSVSRTESLTPVKPPEEAVKPTLPVLKPIETPPPGVEVPSIKPMVIEEIGRTLDSAILDFSDRLSQLTNRENVGVTLAMVAGDPDKLEIEVSVARLGIMKKKERMLKLAESIANLMYEIVAGRKGSQKEIIVTIKHGFEAVRVTKKV